MAAVLDSDVLEISFNALVSEIYLPCTLGICASPTGSCPIYTEGKLRPERERGGPLGCLGTHPSSAFQPKPLASSPIRPWPLAEVWEVECDET